MSGGCTGEGGSNSKGNRVTVPSADLLDLMWNCTQRVVVLSDLYQEGSCFHRLHNDSKIYFLSDTT